MQTRWTWQPLATKSPQRLCTHAPCQGTGVNLHAHVPAGSTSVLFTASRTCPKAVQTASLEPGPLCIVPPSRRGDSSHTKLLAEWAEPLDSQAHQCCGATPKENAATHTDQVLGFSRAVSWLEPNSSTRTTPCPCRGPKNSSNPSHSHPLPPPFFPTNRHPTAPTPFRPSSPFGRPLSPPTPNTSPSTSLSYTSPTHPPLERTKFRSLRPRLGPTKGQRTTNNPSQPTPRKEGSHRHAAHNHCCAEGMFNWRSTRSLCASHRNKRSATRTPLCILLSLVYDL